MKLAALVLLTALFLATAGPASAEGLGLLEFDTSPNVAPSPPPNRLYWQYKGLQDQIRTWEGILRCHCYLLGRDPGNKLSPAQAATELQRQLVRRRIRPTSNVMRAGMARIRTRSNANKAWVRNTKLPRLRRALADVKRRIGVPVR